MGSGIAPDQDRLGAPAGPSANQRGAGFRLDIQGLRALAVLVVVLFHAGTPLVGGYTGVDVFFVISGFVITALIIREHDRRGRVSLSRFYLRRIRRLAPALALVVVATMLISILVLSPSTVQRPAALTGIGATFWLANVAISLTSGGYFDAPAEANPLVNTWSLAVEEQFYILFPIVLAMALRWGRSLRVAAGVLVAITGGSFALAMWGAYGQLSGPLSWLGGFYSPAARAWEFGLGALVALFLAVRSVAGVGWLRWLGWLGLAAMAAAQLIGQGFTAYPNLITLLPTLGAAGVLLGCSGRPGLLNRLLTTRPMVWIGDRSYSWYLWHWPAIVLTKAVVPDRPWVLWVAAAASIVPAALSFRLVEEPIRHARAARWLPTLRTIGLFWTASVAACVLLLVGSSAGWWITWPAYATVSEDRTATGAQACDVAGYAAAGIEPLECWRGDRDEGRTTLVVGDSQSSAMMPAVIAAGQNVGATTLYLGQVGCPFLTVATTGRHEQDCPSWQARTLEYARVLKPDTVVIANLSLWLVNPRPGARILIDEDGQQATTGAEGVREYERGLTDVVTALRSEGIGVVVVSNIPVPDRVDTDPSLLQVALELPHASTFDATDVARRLEPARAVEQRILDQHGGVIVDPFAVLCRDGQCPLWEGDRTLYNDRFHLSSLGTLRLTDAFTHALRTVPD